MSPDRGAVTIPAQVTVSQLADLTGVGVERVRELLLARHESASAGSLVPAHIAVDVAKELGVSLAVEPRDLALEVLYRVEVGGGSPDLSTMPIRAANLVRGVLEHREALDHEIEAVSEHWSVARMPIIDRTILRLGLYELRHGKETPTGVVVSEAVRLAKTYSTERSGAFVNGVLASLAKVPRT
jgi:N utilization substance protein B